MRKWTILLAALMLAGTLSACGAGNLGGSSSPSTESSISESQSSESSDSASNYSHDSKGLAEKLAAKGYIDLEKSQSMRADFIGTESDKGKKYAAVSGTLELYEYDPEALSERAKACIEEVKSTGKVTVMESLGPVDAVLSDNGKYLMIYQDTDDSEEAAARKTAIYEIVKTFE